MEEIIKSTETGKGTVRLYRNGIMHQTYQYLAELTSKDSQAEMEIYYKEYCQEGPRPMLVDIRNLKTVSKESRNTYSSEKTAEYLKAAALIVGNPVSRIMGKFFLGINRSAMPVRVFTDAEKAVEWLKTFL
jgi:hypothetical protein